jgi:hypothetical protein
MRTVANLISEELYVLNADQLLAVRGGENEPEEKKKGDWDYAIKDLDTDDEDLFDIDPA